MSAPVIHISPVADGAQGRDLVDDLADSVLSTNHLCGLCRRPWSIHSGRAEVVAHAEELARIREVEAASRTARPRVLTQPPVSLEWLLEVMAVIYDHAFAKRVDFRFADLLARDLLTMPTKPTTSERLVQAMAIVMDHALARRIDVEIADAFARDLVQDLHLRGIIS